MSKSKKKSVIDENIVAAHHTLEDGALKIGKAGDVLMRRIEDLTSDLEEAQEKHETELAAAQEATRRMEKKLSADIATLQKAKEAEALALKADFDKRESELKAKYDAIEQKLARHEEKLRKVAMELS